MKWLKLETGERNTIEAKLIRRKFGAKGYGIYIALLEVVGEYVERETVDDWGHVDPRHTKETLADECGVTVDELVQFLKFCDENKIFDRRNGKLFCVKIYKKLDEYAERYKGKKRNRKRVGSKSGVSRDNIGNKSGIEKETEREEEQELEIKEKEKEIDRFIFHFNQKMGGAYLATAQRRDKLKLRLQTFSLEQVLKATENLARSDFHRGKNDRGWKATPDFLIRSDEQVDTFLNFTPGKSLPVMPDDELTKLSQQIYGKQN